MPGISNLLGIHSAISGHSIDSIVNEFAGKGYGDFKGAVAEIVVDYLTPIRNRTLELLADPAELTSLMKVGADKANAVATETIQKTYEAMGLIPRG